MKIITLLMGAMLAGVAGVAIAVEPAADPAAAAAPVAPAKDAGQTSQAPAITPSELLARIDAKDPDLVILDVRTPAEYATGHVPGARNVPHDQLPARLAELSSLKDKKVVLYCRSGRRSAIAEQTLRAAGFDKLLHLQGDILAWEAANQPLER